MEKFDLLTLGEVLLRLSPKENKRIVRSTEFESHVGGAELNVASGVSLLGLVLFLNCRQMRSGNWQEVRCVP